MKKSFYVLFAFLLFNTVACTNSDSDNTVDEELNSTSNDIIAETSFGDVTEEEFIQALKDIHGTEVLNDLVYQKLMSSKADELNIREEEILEEVNVLKESVGATNDEQFYQMLHAQGIRGEEDLHNQIVTHLVLQNIVGHSGDFSDEEIRSEYESGEEVEARHILVSDEDKANDLIERLNNGEDFADLAKEHSTDHGSGANGGDLGFFGRGTMTPAFEEGVFKLEIGEISEPIESQYGFHIIEVTDRKLYEDDFEEVKDILRNFLNDRMLNKMGQAQLDLFKTVEVNVLDEQFSPLPSFNNN